MNESKSIFIIDVPRISIGDEVVITGSIIKKDKFSKNKFGIWIRDITGTILIIIDNSIDPIALHWDQNNIWVNNRIRITGKVGLNSKDSRIINNVSEILVLGTLQTEISKLDSEMREQTSRVLMSRICRSASGVLMNTKFTELESNMISHQWAEDGLEPLMVVYPGFGSPAVLITSPAAQLIDFLTATLIPRAFTVSTSFTSSYRFMNGSAETRVIVAKALDLDMEDYVQLLLDISTNILINFYEKIVPIEKLYGEWPDKIDGFDYDQKLFDNELNLVTFEANIPVIGKNWDTRISSITQLLDKEKNILLEGARESLGEKIVISSITIYPSQFLGLIEKAPRRQLQNLIKMYDGKKLYE